MPFTTPNLQIGKDNVLFFENSRLILKKRCHCAAEMQLLGYYQYDEFDGGESEVWWACANEHEEFLTGNEEDMVEMIEESFEENARIRVPKKSLLEFVV